MAAGHQCCSATCPPPASPAGGSILSVGRREWRSPLCVALRRARVATKHEQGTGIGDQGRTNPPAGEAGCTNLPAEIGPVLRHVRRSLGEDGSPGAAKEDSFCHAARTPGGAESRMPSPECRVPNAECRVLAYLLHFAQIAKWACPVGVRFVMRCPRRLPLRAPGRM